MSPTGTPRKSLASVHETEDWRREIPESGRRPVRLWLWSIAGMTLLTLIVGGITRLTQSGLSIVDWAPLMGVVPPMGEVAWQEAFDAYRAYPEYRELRQGMTLDEFRFIYFWEYIHRLVARAIGLVFLLPFAYFAVRGHLTRSLAGRTLLLFMLGAAQGAMGWFMVTSGLVDVPRVSHYRLAAHLSLAVVIFGYAVWLARDLAVGDPGPPVSGATQRLLRNGLAFVGALLAVQIVWGAFVAGLRAGLYYNTFPLMGGGILPPDFLRLEPALLNLVENPSAVQWMHRLLGTLLLGVAGAFYLRVRRAPDLDSHARLLNPALFGMIGAQYLLGVLTLLLVVPVWLGVTHQAMAMILVGVWLVWVHSVREAGRAAGPADLISRRG
ncbi:MAG: COX15/CtaA family protein [Gemmatimonadota bacterium]